MTDDGKWYTRVGEEFASHESTQHAKCEYVRGDIHTNTVEGFFSILKRGIIGTYHHVSEAHLDRYLAESDFRYSNRAKLGVSDGERAAKALKPGFSRWLPNWREYSRISGLPARQKRGSDSYRHLGQPERWSGADLAIFSGILTHFSHRLLLNV
jgi:hypothetical protein